MSALQCGMTRASRGQDTERQEPSRIYVTLPAGARRLFDQLVNRKLYGDKDAEVARHLIIVALDELVEKGRLTESD
jgi:hypothetical protein